MYSRYWKAIPETDKSTWQTVSSRCQCGSHSAAKDGHTHIQTILKSSPFQYRVESFTAVTVTCNAKKLTSTILLQHTLLDIESIVCCWDDLIICCTSIIRPIDATPHYSQVQQIIIMLAVEIKNLAQAHIELGRTNRVTIKRVKWHNRAPVSVGYLSIWCEHNYK